jgi:hypothetical protein
MDREIEERRLPVDWPPLHDGPNELGPTDKAGEYRAAAQQPPASEPPARVPGEVRPYEQPIDVASESVLPPELPEGQLSDAERAVRDARHIARGKPSMSSSEGSS